MWPDPESYDEAIKRLADREIEPVLTAGFALQLIAADGKVTPEEAAFAELPRDTAPADFRRSVDKGRCPGQSNITSRSSSYIEGQAHIIGGANSNNAIMRA